jgi:hypothetical protein
MSRMAPSTQGGRAFARRSWRHSRRSPMSTTEPFGILSARILVVVELLVTGTLGDGSKARFHACDILTLRDGLIAAKRSYRKVVE